MRDYTTQMDAARKGIITPDMKKVAANFAKRKPAAAKPSASAEEPTPECPLCGNAMAKRHSKDGKEFWGCTAYPACRGTRNI